MEDSSPPPNPPAKKQKVEEEEEAFVLLYAIGFCASIPGMVIRQFEKTGLTLKRLRLTNVDSEFARRFIDNSFWLQYSDDEYYFIPFSYVRPKRCDEGLSDSASPFITEYDDPYDVSEILPIYRPSMHDMIGGPVVAMTFEGKDAITKMRSLTTLRSWGYLNDSRALSRIEGSMMYSSASPLCVEHDIKFWFGDENLDWLHDYTKKEVAWRYPFSDGKQDKYSPLLYKKFEDVAVVDPPLLRKEELKLICINRSSIRDRHVGDILIALRKHGILFGMRLIDQEDFVKNEKNLSSIGLKKDQLPVVIMVWAWVYDNNPENLKGKSTANIDWSDIMIDESVDNIYKWFPCGMVHWPFSYCYTRQTLFEGP